MPRTGFAGSLMSPKVDLIVDMGNPFLNLTVDGFLKIGGVAVAKAATEETYDIFKKGNISHHKFEHSLKKMCREGAYWGTIAGVYVGMEYGVERIRGTRDWVIALLLNKFISKQNQFSMRGSKDVLTLTVLYQSKNATIGGAITGALVSAASNNKRDQIVMDAISGGAIATAAEFLNHLT